MASARESPRSIERIGFDRFVFERAIDLRGDGATSQRGVEAARAVVVGAIAWPEMPTNWLVLSSRHDQNPLELDIEHDPIVQSDIADRFLVDSDDDDLSFLMSDELSDWLIDLDERVGPIHLILDGPGERQDGVATVFLARTMSSVSDPDPAGAAQVDMAKLVASVLDLLRDGQPRDATVSAPVES